MRLLSRIEATSLRAGDKDGDHGNVDEYGGGYDGDGALHSRSHHKTTILMIFFRSLPPRESLLKRKMSSKASVFSWKSRSVALNLIEAWAMTKSKNALEQFGVVVMILKPRSMLSKSSGRRLQRPSCRRL